MSGAPARAKPPPYRPADFDPASRRGLHGRVVDRLGIDIVTGVADPGATLMTDDLCAHFNVSRSVLRESLRVLEAKGLVTARPRVGTRVRPRSDWNLLDPELLGWLVHGPDYQRVLRELIELRTGIEPLAARLAAVHADDTHVRALIESARRMTTATDASDRDGYLAADLDFHAALFAASGNRPLQQFGEVVRSSLETRAELLDSEINPADCHMHADLASAVRDRDAEAAARIMRTIIAETGKRQVALRRPLSGGQTVDYWLKPVRASPPG